jgi:hypothetical protein
LASSAYQKSEIPLIPAKARIQGGLGPRFRGDERIFTSAFFPAQVRGIDF